MDIKFWTNEELKQRLLVAWKHFPVKEISGNKIIFYPVISTDQSRYYTYCITFWSNPDNEVYGATLPDVIFEVLESKTPDGEGKTIIESEIDLSIPETLDLLKFMDLETKKYYRIAIDNMPSALQEKASEDHVESIMHSSGQQQGITSSELL